MHEPRSRSLGVAGRELAGEIERHNAQRETETHLDLQEGRNAHIKMNDETSGVLGRGRGKKEPQAHNFLSNFKCKK